ncbi:phosphatase PAP2 family protein [Hyphomicrobium sp.]|jgi:hypothetical protein|uniref:phosphatase PAP2 family protein n=1 Tax=Hyphomicrobium sp. TaxID=82 RepID=UPI003569BFA3
MSISFREVPEASTSEETIRKTLAILRDAWHRAMRPAWTVIAIGAVALAVLCATTSFGVTSWAAVIQMITAIATFLGVSILFGRAQWHRTALAFEAAALFNATVVVALPLESILASAAFPYQDSMLVAVDRAMGFDWPALAFWFRDHPALTNALCHAYASINWQPFVIIPALAFAHPQRLRCILTISTVALSATLMVFLVAPAIGPYAYFHFTAVDFPAVKVPAAWIAPSITNALRSGSNEFHFAGLVTFPSYHAVVALLFAFGWLAVPYLRWLFVPLNLLMLVSCVPIGSHYVIDVVVGAAMVLAGHLMISRYFEATDHFPPLPPWRRTQSQAARYRPDKATN